ncbi:MAG: hypothetical protein IIZ92_17085 [Aquincola sp.]|nr:hypothetical protein [Aquincola sp.]
MVLLGAGGSVAFPHRRQRAVTLGLLLVVASACIVLAHAMGLPRQAPWPLVWWSSPITSAVFLASGAATTLMATHRLAQGQLVATAVLRGRQTERLQTGWGVGSGFRPGPSRRQRTTRCR